MKYKKLVVISHTPHQVLPDGTTVGWGPTIAELNYLAQYWNELVHVACREPYTNNPSLQPYKNNHIRFAPIPRFGGITFLQKLSVFYQAPQIIWQIVKSLNGATHVQIRVPMGIGVYVLPIFLFVPRKFILWVKYANNWGHVSNSLGYRFQHWILKKNSLKCPVTINGFWQNQAKHLKSFENPCITETQLNLGSSLNKDFNGPFKLVFVGRLESAKGIDLLMDSLASLPKGKIEEWVFLGDGPLKGQLKTEVMKEGVKASFLGFVSQEVVHEELKEAHFLILPSRSEGFPKVIAEAWNYGCIPIISAVGSIPHYLEDGVNGFIISELKMEGIAQTIDKVLNSDHRSLDVISKKGNNMAKRFTFNHYLQHLKESVFGDH